MSFLLYVDIFILLFSNVNPLYFLVGIIVILVVDFWLPVWFARVRSFVCLGAVTILTLS